MRDLTKWPRLLVAGQPVTEEQANEILVRTDSWALMGNDRQWTKMLADAISVTLDPRHGMPNWEAVDEFRKSIGSLNLGYLHNDRIYSSWVGGPHGWCSWSGRIGCSTYNIGKWPSADKVTEDWTVTAAAFPYLDLTAQLISDEGQLVGQWVVKGGAVAYDPEPTELIRPVDELESAQILSVFSLAMNGRERGVGIGRLTDALRQVEISRAVES